MNINKYYYYYYYYYYYLLLLLTESEVFTGKSRTEPYWPSDSISQSEHAVDRLHTQVI